MAIEHGPESLTQAKEYGEMTPNKLLSRILAISEGTPYHGTIVAASGEDNLSLDGDVVFRLEKGRLWFDFFVDPESESRTGYEITSISWGDRGEVILQVPSQCFKYPIRIASAPHEGPMVTGQPRDRERLTGHVTSNSVGLAKCPLSSATVYIRDLPGGIWGRHNTFYRSAVMKDERETLPAGHVLNSFTLRGGGWKVYLQAIPEERRVAGGASHVCAVTRGGSTFTGIQLMELLEHDLGPYLCLMFGQYVMWSMVEGHSPPGNYPASPWGMIFGDSSRSVRALGPNWFLSSEGGVDPSPPFEKFCSMPLDRKRHFRKVIERYVESETILATIGLFEEATAVSFSGLEGLVRSVISTYPCRDKWLKRVTLELKVNSKRGVTTQKAIELVVTKEFGRLAQQEDLVRAIREIRNSVVHTDLIGNDANSQKTFNRWKACQLLIEAILLSQLGLKSIPNRTQPERVKILGQEVLSEARKYAVRQE